MTTTLCDPGRQKSVIYPTGQALTLSFDPAGRRTVMQEASGALSTYTYTSQYNGPIFLDGPEGLRTRFDYFGGQVQHSGGYVSGGVQSLGQAFLFDAPGQVSALLTYHLNVPGFSGLGISYDTAGQVRQTTEAGSTRNYAYDAAGQLTGDQLINVVPFQLTFSYDLTGNRLTRLDGAARTTYVYDAANQLQTEKLGAAITSYSYDQNGNRASQVTGAAITSYSWDEENRLTGIAYPDATLATYMYSADGVRQRKIDSTGTVNYLWDESRLLQETDVSLVEVMRYTQGIEGWQTMSGQRRGGVDSFFAYDQIGNTRQLVDITGAVTDTTTYEAFGVERARTGTTVNNFQFGGQYGYQRDEATRLYVRARHLDTARGNWLSRDPMGFDGGDWNLYRYVGNDPVSGVDPTGMARWLEVVEPNWPVYIHAYIEFTTNPCMVGGKKIWGFGFYPWKQWPPKFPITEVIPWRGKIKRPEPYLTSPGQRRLVKQWDDPNFENYLCSCINDSIKHPPVFHPLWKVCGSWANQMWDCGLWGVLVNLPQHPGFVYDVPGEGTRGHTPVGYTKW